MNNLLKNSFRKLVPCIGFVALIASSTFAQLAKSKPAPRTDSVTPRADIVAPTVEGQLKPSQIVVNRRPEIPFRPFPVVDTKTGKPVSRDTMMPRLLNGRRFTFGQYWDGINNLEEQLNALGWTLRPAPGDKPGTPKKMALQQIPTPVAKLQQQGRIAYVPNLQFQPLDVTQAVQKQQALRVIDPGLLKAVGARQPNTLKEVKNWNLSFGDPGVISVFLNGKVELDGTSTSTSLDAEANAGGSLFSHRFDILQLSGKLSSPQAGPLNINLSASVLGKTVYNVNQNATSTFSKSDSISKTLDESATVQFVLLGIPMSAKVGVQGKAGLTYAVTVAPVKATGSVAPSISSNAYAQVGIDVGVASAGAGGRLTILNLNGNLNGDVAIVADAKNNLTYSYDAQYCQNFDTLDGTLFAFARIGDCDFFGLCAEADNTFFSFTGIKSSGCLFSESRTAPVFAQSQTLPAKR